MDNVGFERRMCTHVDNAGQGAEFVWRYWVRVNLPAVMESTCGAALPLR